MPGFGLEATIDCVDMWTSGKFGGMLNLQVFARFWQQPSARKMPPRKAALFGQIYVSDLS
jgi:hypothetical protein